MGPRPRGNKQYDWGQFYVLRARLRDSRIVEVRRGSIFYIEGRDTILFVGKGSEHCKLTNVNFIPRLKANLVSIDQLDEVGCYIYIECRLFKIWDDRQRLLTQVRRTANCLYIMELKIK